MKFIGYRTLKTGVGTAVAIIIAEALGLQYAVSAGIITILSIQNTKRKSAKIAMKRLTAFLIAVAISIVIFNIFGYSPIAFGVFMLLFIPLAVRFKAEDGIVPVSVLISHLLLQKSTNFYWIYNEFMILAIGVVIALILNIYMPNLEEEIKKYQISIERNMKIILFNMARTLREQTVYVEEEALFNTLEKDLKKAKDLGYMDLNSSYFQKESYYLKYMEMRIAQFETLKRIREHFQRFHSIYYQTIMIAELTEKVADCIEEKNTARNLLGQVFYLRQVFTKMELPKTRVEFESRAMLLAFINDLEEFLKIKNKFREAIKS